MASWVISANSKIYNYQKSFVDYGFIDWRQGATKFEVGDIVLIEGIQKALILGETKFEALCIGKDKKEKVLLELNDLTKPEKEILLAGSLINSYQK